MLLRLPALPACSAHFAALSFAFAIAGAPAQLNIHPAWLSHPLRSEHLERGATIHMTFLLSLATVGAAFWLRQLASARPLVAAPVRAQRVAFRPVKS